MICPECGQELDSNNVCQNPDCITKVKKEYEKNQSIEFRDENGISPIEMLEFLNYKNTNYYMDKWTRFQDNPKFISWNWPAFLFGILWFWFRKMYNLAGILLAINLSSIILLYHFGWLQSIVSLILTIGSGLLANQLYINHAIKKIQSAKFTTLVEFDNSMLFRRLNSIGGINWAPLFVAIILLVVSLPILRRFL